MRSVLGGILAILLCCPGLQADELSDLDKGAARMAKALWPRAKGVKGRIRVLDFIPPSAAQDKRTRLGRLLSERLSADLMRRRAKDDDAVFELGERLDTLRLMDELDLWGGTDRAAVERLREKEPLDGLVVGAWQLVDERLTAAVRLIDAKTGGVLAEGGFELEAGAGLDRLLGPDLTERSAPARLVVDAAVVYRGSGGKLRQVHGGMALRRARSIGIYLRPGQECFAYVFLEDSRAQVTRLFPDAGPAAGGSRLAAQEARWLPGAEGLYELEDVKDGEAVHLIVSSRRLEALEGLTLSMKDEWLHRSMGLGLRKAKRSVPEDARLPGPPRDRTADFLPNRLSADGDSYWTLPFVRQ